MYGEGYDWAQQYSVSSGDFVGSLPVGMQSRGVSDLPYWPSQNTYVFKEVWVHSTSRWLWMMSDMLAPVAASVPETPPGLSVSHSVARNGEVTIRLEVRGEGRRTFAVRTDNLAVRGASKTVTLRPGRTATVEWKGRPVDDSAPWVALVVPDGDVARGVELFGQVR